MILWVSMMDSKNKMYTLYDAHTHTHSELAASNPLEFLMVWNTYRNLILGTRRRKRKNEENETHLKWNIVNHRRRRKTKKFFLCWWNKKREEELSKQKFILWVIAHTRWLSFIDPFNYKSKKQKITLPNSKKQKKTKRKATKYRLKNVENRTNTHTTELLSHILHTLYLRLCVRACETEPSTYINFNLSIPYFIYTALLACWFSLAESHILFS